MVSKEAVKIIANANRNVAYNIVDEKETIIDMWDIKYLITDLLNSCTEEERKIVMDKIKLEFE